MAAIAEDEVMAGSDERLATLEERMSNLSGDIRDLKEINHSTSESLKKLVILEERHRTSDVAIGRIFAIIEKNSERLDVIELQIPNLSLASSWVFRAVLAIMALTGITYIVTILKSVGMNKP